MLFWKLPGDKYLSFIPRTGSTAWGQAILDAFYPAEKMKQYQANTPDNELAGPQYFIPNSRDPVSGTLYGVVRDPIERFRSGFSRAALGKSVDEVILGLGNPGLVNIHIRRITDQFSRKMGDIQWYCYESGLDVLAAAIGLSATPDMSNESVEEDKPVLTDEQIVLLNEYYAADIALWQNTCS